MEEDLTLFPFPPSSAAPLLVDGADSNQAHPLPTYLFTRAKGVMSVCAVIIISLLHSTHIHPARRCISVLCGRGTHINPDEARVVPELK